jgi:hypothetical protein
VEIKFSYQDLVNQIKRDVPVKDAKTRANKTEEISKQENCKISQACSIKKEVLFVVPKCVLCWEIIPLLS